VSIELKTPQDIERMRVAGRLAAEVLDFIAPHVKPGAPVVFDLELVQVLK